MWRYPTGPMPKTQAKEAKRDPIVIGLFNHKGGVSKTTTSFNLGWKMAERGRRVMIVDADPQCNLTGTALSFEGVQDFEDFYQREPNNNLHAALAPAFSGMGRPLAPVQLRSTKQPNLFVLPGHIEVATYEAQLAVSFNTSTFSALANLPGAPAHLFRLLARTNGIDVVLVDMSPSVGAFNQSLFLSCDYFIVPTSPDYFCYLAIGSLCNVLPRWSTSVGHLRGNRPDLVYPLPPNGPKFLGILSQRYRPRSGDPAVSFQSWIDRINDAVAQKLVPELAKLGMSVTEQEFRNAGAAGEPYNLANIADFNSLIAISHDENTPAFALTDQQIKRTGTVLNTMRESRDRFSTTFEQLAGTVERMIGLTLAPPRTGRGAGGHGAGCGSVDAVGPRVLTDHAERSGQSIHVPLTLRVSVEPRRPPPRRGVLGPKGPDGAVVLRHAELDGQASRLGPWTVERQVGGHAVELLLGHPGQHDHEEHRLKRDAEEDHPNLRILGARHAQRHAGVAVESAALKPVDAGREPFSRLRGELGGDGREDGRRAVVFARAELTRPLVERHQVHDNGRLRGYPDVRPGGVNAAGTEREVGNIAVEHGQPRRQEHVVFEHGRPPHFTRVSWLLTARRRACASNRG